MDKTKLASRNADDEKHFQPGGCNFLKSIYLNLLRQILLTKRLPLWT